MILQDRASIPVTETEWFVRWYEEKAEDSLSPPTMDELNTVRRLLPDAVPEVWTPDLEAEARNRSFDQGDDNRLLARKRYFEDLKAARQNERLPQVYVRRLEQISEDLYPNLRILDYDRGTGPSQAHEAYLQNRDFWKDRQLNKQEFYAFRRRRRFKEVRDWLTALPLQQSEEVYFASDYPQDTVILTWQMLINCWDFFVPESGIYTTNVIDDTAGWYLVFYTEQIAIFGCTDQFAERNKVSSNTFAPSSERLNDLVLEYRTLVRATRANNDFNSFIASSAGTSEEDSQ